MDPSFCSFELTRMMFESRLTRLEQCNNELTNELYHANQKINHLQEICIEIGLTILFGISKIHLPLKNSSYKLQRAKTAFNPKIIAGLAFKPNYQFIFFLRKTLLEPCIRQDLTKLSR